MALGGCTGQGRRWGSCLEGLFVGTAAHYVPDKPYSLRYLLSPGYLLGDLRAEAADLVNCAKQDGESHPGGAAASCPACSETGAQPWAPDPRPLVGP